MKQKKYLGRRIFALSLALLLCLNTATAYAAPDVSSGYESTETVSQDTKPSVEQGESETAEETENTESKTETETENKGSGDSDTLGENTGENEEDTADKSTGETEETETSENDADEVETDADADEIDNSSVEEADGEEAELEEPSEEEPEEMPQEVRAFLDAAAALPSADEVTAENAEKIGEQVNAAFDLYNVLIETDTGYAEREDVAGAIEKVKAVSAAVQDVIGELEAEKAVRAFLNAVAAVEVPEEDLTLEENADLAESYREAVLKAFELYEALSEEQQEMEEVAVSFMELENMAMVLPEYGISTYALSNVVVRPDYNPGQCYPGVSRHGGSVTKSVGESGFYKRRAVKNFYCQGCGWFYGQSSGKEYANIQWEQSVDGVISDVSFQAGTLEGSQCLEMDFTGAMAGTTLVTIQYDVNFHTRWNSGYASCPGCGAMTSVQQYDDSWYHYVDTFYVTVVSPQSEQQVWYVYVPTDGIENGSATIELNALVPAGAIGNYNDAFMPIRNVKLSDPNGVRGNYADISYRLTRSNTFVTGYYSSVTYNYGINLTVNGLNEPTPNGEPLSVFLDYDWPYSCQLISPTDNYMYYNVQWGNHVTGEIRIIVYEPETVTIGVGEENGYTHTYGPEMTGGSLEALTYGAYVRTLNEAKNSPNKPTASDTDILKLNYNIKAELNTSPKADWYKVYGTENGIGKTAKVSTTYTYFGTYVGSGSNYIFVYPRTTYVDVVKYKVVNDTETTTPVTIVKEFDGISEEQIPDNFALTYRVSGCADHNGISGTLQKSAAALTNTDGTPRLSWSVELPVAKHGSAEHTITFTESNAGVDGYKNPTMGGNTVKLEALTAEDGAEKPVITVTNRYELEDNVFELFYDFNGGTDGPDTQVYRGTANEISHEFNVAGKESPIKIPTNGDKVFKGWSEERNGDVKYAYDSETEKYDPAKVTVVKENGKSSASKTLYAVWEEYTAPQYRLDSLVKERIKSGELPAGVTLPENVIVNDDDTVVFLGDNPAPVTLLYKITVNGTAGAKYKVTDPGAEWVSGGDAHKKEGSTLVVTGTIKEGSTSAVIYVTKTFTKGDIKNGKLTNEAELESNNPDTEDPENGKGTGTSDTEKKYTVTINFITDDEDPEILQDASRNEFEENEKFGFGVDKPQAQKAALRSAAGAGTTAISVPYTITKNGKTYVLDETASKDALDALKAAGAAGVTSDIVKDLIYTLDMKGGSDTDKEEGGSDGVPDKYQAKIVYQAAEGGSQDGEDGYVTIKNGEEYAAEGTANVSANATADQGFYFDNWTAAAAEDSSFSYTPSEESKLTGTIDVKGGAVYTFTANFASKTVLHISITGNNDTVVYNGSEQSVTGYTMVVTDKDGNEIELPDSLTVTPAQAECSASGTEVNNADNQDYPERYPMGLTAEKFSVAGDNAARYTVTFDVTDGWLKITEREKLTVTAGDVTAVYDGSEQPVTPVVTVGETLRTEDAEITVVYVDAEGNESSDAPVDAGTYRVRVTAKLDGYDDATCEATVTIARRRLSVTTASAAKTYDGTPLTDSTAAVVVEGGAVAGEEITATATGSRIEVGSTVNTYRLNWGNAKASNYEVRETLGTLTVNAATGGGGTGGGGGNSDPDPTPAPPTPETTPIIPGPVPAVGPEPVVPVVTPVAPTAPVAAPTATAALVSPTPEAVALAEEEVPLAGEEEREPQPVEMNEEEIPLAGGNGAGWALINFALMNLAIFEALMLLIGYFVNTKNDKEDEDEKRKLKKKGIFRIISLPIAVISLIVFILTEDITLPTAFVDKYTIVMLIIAVVQTVVVALSNKKYEDKEEA